MQNQYGTPVVIDNGSGFCKVGISEGDEPKACFPSIVGRPKYQKSMATIEAKETYVGEEALAKKGILKLVYPIENGIVWNWDDMTTIWHHCFYNQLKVTPSEQPCLITQGQFMSYLVPKNPYNNRERMAEIFFETFQVPAFYIGLSPVLSLYSSGKTTGLVLDSGDGVTNAVSVYEGYHLPHTIERQNSAGRDLTDYMAKLLNQQTAYEFTSSTQKQYVRNIKQSHAYVALDFDAEMQKYEQGYGEEMVHELPDGSKLNLGSQRFRCPQALFKPIKLGKELPGIHEMIHQSILKSDVDIRNDLYRNVVLSGGSTMFSGIQQRLTKQLNAIVKEQAQVRVYASKQRKFLTWLGGSILSSLSTFQTMWITKAEYQENGAQIVHKKCY